MNEDLDIYQKLGRTPKFSSVKSEPSKDSLDIYSNRGPKNKAPVNSNSILSIIGQALSSQPVQQITGVDYKRLPEPLKNFSTGAVRGGLQGLNDIASSVWNLPLEAAEYASGAKLPRVAHTQWANENPESMSERIGQNVGQFAAPMALPIGAAFGAANAAKSLPFLGRLAAAAAGGAAEGYATNEGNRGTGAALGALGGAASYGLNSAVKSAMGMRSKNIAQSVEKEAAQLKNQFKQKFNSAIKAGEEAGANKFLKSEPKSLVSSLKKLGEGKLSHGLEEFNKSPTLSNAHKAQSDLNKIISKYSSVQEGSRDSKIYAEALKAKNRLLQKIAEAFEKSGASEHGAGYQQARSDYATQYAPYKNSPAVRGLLGQNKMGIQTVRPDKFADKILREEEFLAQAGKNHPDLLRRESLSELVRNPLVHTGIPLALGATGVGAALPYFLRKELNV